MEFLKFLAGLIAVMCILFLGFYQIERVKNYDLSVKVPGHPSPGVQE